MDSTQVKMHRSGANPAGGQAAQAIGISRGGLHTKIPAVVAGNGEPLALPCTSGNCHDSPQALPLINPLGRKVSSVVADTVCDANATRTASENTGSQAMPPAESRPQETRQP